MDHMRISGTEPSSFCQIDVLIILSLPNIYKWRKDLYTYDIHRQTMYFPN